MLCNTRLVLNFLGHSICRAPVCHPVTEDYKIETVYIDYQNLEVRYIHITFQQEFFNAEVRVSNIKIKIFLNKIPAPAQFCPFEERLWTTFELKGDSSSFQHLPRSTPT